jgi:hypothetical protein
MTSLSERAEQAAAAFVRNPLAAGIGPALPPEAPAPVSPGIDMSSYVVAEGDPDQVPVHLAWLRVRRDIGSIAKAERYSAGSTGYNFRGVDTVVRAFGPITLNHGVSVLPIHVDAAHRDTTSSKGSQMRECTVTVTYLIVGPMGDTIQLQSSGEALDSADKGTAKAQSVALRVLLLSGGLIPTGDPDPDASRVDRGEKPIRAPSSYATEITDPRTSAGRLRQILAELKQARQMDALVANEAGEEEKIGPMVVRIGTERAAAEEAGA